jgi:hypothetical protein
MSSRSCVPYAASRYQPDMITILATDLLLAAAMLIGLFRMEEARRYGVARYLYRQVSSNRTHAVCLEQSLIWRKI